MPRSISLFQPEQNEKPRWKELCDTASEGSSTICVCSPGFSGIAEEAIARNPSTATYVNSSLAIRLDLTPASDGWAAAFPRLKEQGAVYINSEAALALNPPDSVSDALLQLSNSGVAVAAEPSGIIEFDVFAATMPLADEAASFDHAVARHLRESTYPDRVLAGLLLANGQDEASHRVSQSREGTQDYDYWHGLMHRREPDFGNAGYWFRRVGDHPLFSELPEAIAEVAAAEDVAIDSEWTTSWDAMSMIDACRVALKDERSDYARQVRLVQQIEYATLLQAMSDQ